MTKEIKEIVRAYDAARKLGKQAALATVVQVQGSAYRRPGARMLITEDGCLTGAISGGCLEGDALRKAQLVMAQQKSRLVTYDTTDEDDAKIGVGLGCNGIIHLLIEPIDAHDRGNPIELLRATLANRQNAVVVTLFSLSDRNGFQPGTSLEVLKDGTVAGNIAGKVQVDNLLEDVASVMDTHRSVITSYGEIDAFIEFIRPCVAIVIVGAGNDIIPLVQIADTLGWDITIADGRPGYPTSDRFPTVKKLVVGKPKDVFPFIDFDGNTVWVLMTHNYNYDLAALQELVATDAMYIGVLGPKKKLERMLNELVQRGVVIDTRQLHRIYGPIGLDIGAETPEEIAISIVAEIKAVMSAKNPKPLRTKKESIHSV